ncbi:hypothetical protein H8356DRAFT_1343998 [Neocallimastix lanati (nom. inval.)]|nr:hypothetical protein H8356DRAFT_1343998 [Neocallimastix sp. JGI-2020a]
MTVSSFYDCRIISLCLINTYETDTKDLSSVRPNCENMIIDNHPFRYAQCKVDYLKQVTCAITTISKLNKSLNIRKVDTNNMIRSIGENRINTSNFLNNESLHEGIISIKVDFFYDEAQGTIQLPQDILVQEAGGITDNHYIILPFTPRAIDTSDVTEVFRSKYSGKTTMR